MNLIEDRWIPVRRQNDEEERIAPWELTDNFESNPIVALAAPRPDFKGGLTQFLIGLLQTAVPPDEAQGLEWEDWLEQPPDPGILKKAFAPYTHCFNLAGEGPRFMQDLKLEDGKEAPINALLIDAPGENTLRQNADYFVKRGGISSMCCSCAATALFTLQTNAPAGGKGNRTSLRGGGPLTSLVILDPQGSGLETDTLWYNLWLNILDRHVAGKAADPDHPGQQHIFPWLAPTRSSEPKTGRDTYSEDVHPLQVYWGMPRRIRLDFDRTGEGICDICATSTSVLVAYYATRPYGVNYAGAWQHPLSPHWIDKDGTPSPLHPQPGGFTYRYWINITEGSESYRSARVVTEFKHKRQIQKEEQFRLWIFGYDMDNMKPRNWYETVFPLYLFRDEDLRRNFSIRVQEKIEAAAMVADLVRMSVRDAWFKRPGDVRGDLTFVKERFFSLTESNFFSSLRRLYQTLVQEEDGREVLSSWYNVLRHSALKLFEDCAAREDAAFADMKRIALARRKLLQQLSGNKLRQMLHIPTRRKERAV